jgi:DNA-binding MarR family transcriptional regulator
MRMRKPHRLPHHNREPEQDRSGIFIVATNIVSTYIARVATGIQRLEAPMARRSVTQVELAGVKLMRVSDAFNRRFQGLFKRHGVSAPQYNVLRILRGAGPAGLRCAEIADRMITRVPDITRLLDRLVEKGLVDRRRSENDRRAVISLVTPAGLALLDDIDAPLQARIRENFRALDTEEIARLDALLTRLLDAFELKTEKRA